MTTTLPALPEAEGLPPILAGHVTPTLEKRVRGFYGSVAEIFETWVSRRSSAHTQRAYRQDIMHFVAHRGLRWPEEAHGLLAVAVQDVQAYRAGLVASGAAPKTVNRRISSLSSFYKYLGAAAAELRLPIVVPNPAHSQFIPREASDPVDETRALGATRARQLMGLPAGDSLLDCRDRAILKFYLYTGARLAAGCQLKVSDFHLDEDEATVVLSEKGHRRRKIGLHFAAAQAIREYLEAAEITSGALFRPRLNSRSRQLADRAFDPMGMYHLIQGYLEQLPGAIKEVQRSDGTVATRCVYTPTPCGRPWRRCYSTPAASS